MMLQPVNQLSYPQKFISIIKPVTPIIVGIALIALAALGVLLLTRCFSSLFSRVSEKKASPTNSSTTPSEDAPPTQKTIPNPVEHNLGNKTESRDQRDSEIGTHETDSDYETSESDSDYDDYFDEIHLSPDEIKRRFSGRDDTDGILRIFKQFKIFRYCTDDSKIIFQAQAGCVIRYYLYDPAKGITVCPFEKVPTNKDPRWIIK